ncbi:MAG: capsular biosynthesis protein [Spirosomaceae bacterium]|nr:capsular biosynthesis protein [Spirosomataceae bacterium]
MFSTFFQSSTVSKTTVATSNTIMVDVHSHLLPHFDDGVDNFNQSIQLVVEFQKMGYKKLVLTPHIMQGYYERSVEELTAQADELQFLLKRSGIPMVLDLAAEYYLDDYFFELLESKKPLLTLQKNNRYLLVETSFVAKKEFIFNALERIVDAGYIPVLSHPESYSFLKDDLELLRELRMKGMLFQVNINSLIGYYSKQARQNAELLINQRLVSFVGTDCRSFSQLTYLRKAMITSAYDTVCRQDLLNNSFLNSSNSSQNITRENRSTFVS